MVGKIKEEAWTLNSADTTAIPSASRSDGTANQWIDIWTYQVPTGQAHILKPNHHFSAYIEDGSTEVSSGTCQLRITVADSSKHDRRVVYGDALYIASKEFQDRDKMATLDLRTDLSIPERFHIIVEILDDGTIDESDSYFKLETIRIRPTI